MKTPSPAALLQRLQATFPFPNYFYIGLSAHAHILAEVQRLLPKGGRVLDVGCGPLDKTAPLAWAGYQCDAIDDFTDPWHRAGDNLNKIKAFAKKAGIKLKVGDGQSLPYKAKSFDLVMLNDVLEHMPVSPRGLINASITLLKPGGYLVVTVPNAVNIRKRMAVLRGQTNLPPYNQFYWSEGPWRGHIREYVKDDLAKLALYTGLQVEKLESCHHMLGVLPRWAQPMYRALSALFPEFKDSWILVARRPANWAPQTDMQLAAQFGVNPQPTFIS